MIKGKIIKVGIGILVVIGLLVLFFYRYNVLDLVTDKTYLNYQHSNVKSNIRIDCQVDSDCKLVQDCSYDSINIINDEESWLAYIGKNDKRSSKDGVLSKVCLRSEEITFKAICNGNKICGVVENEQQNEVN